MRILIDCLFRLGVPSGEIPMYRGDCARTGGRPGSRASMIAAMAVPWLLWSTGVGLAQTVDTSLWVTDGAVCSMVRDAGTIYIGGSFTRVGPATGCGVAIDASTGAAQQPYPRVAGYVRAVAPDGSGGWYLGGSFTLVRGQARNNLAQLDAAGNLTGWSPDANGEVRALAVSGGTVYAGGDFDSIGGQPRNKIAALDAVTGAATAWDPNATGGYYQSRVLTLAVSGARSTPAVGSPASAGSHATTSPRSMPPAGLPAPGIRTRTAASTPWR